MISERLFVLQHSNEVKIVGHFVNSVENSQGFSLQDGPIWKDLLHSFVVTSKVTGNRIRMCFQEQRDRQTLNVVGWS